jgi:signal peptidase
MRAVLRALWALLLVALLSASLLVATGRVRLQPVLTGSMAPRYPTGTLVAVTPVDPATLRVGDVVMFVPPSPYRTPTGGPVLHRVVSLGTGPDGHLQLRTKGDANAALDPWTIDATHGGLAKLRASSLAAGRAVAVLRHTTHGPALLVWPGLLLLWWSGRRGRRPVPYRPRHALGSRAPQPS